MQIILTPTEIFQMLVQEIKKRAVNYETLKTGWRKTFYPCPLLFLADDLLDRGILHFSDNVNDILTSLKFLKF